VSIDSDLACFHELAALVVGRDVSPEERNAFRRYLELVREWSRVHNLVGVKKPHDILAKLFLDSLLFLHALPEGPLRVADVGSGGGFPGLPLRIVAPRLAMALIESRRKRVSFLRTVVRELGLEGVDVMHGRAEELGLERSFDAVVMRAVAGVPEAVRVGARLLRPGGELVISVAVHGPRWLPGYEAERRVISVPGTAISKSFLILRAE
jgi:16S rRNA (guanine527-N7)-methyltransferase